jgi:hypothetical protein
MKKKIICIGIVSLFLLVTATTVSAGPEVDQYLEPNNETYWRFGIVDDTKTFAQKFVPSFNRLTQVSLYLDNRNADSQTDDLIKLSIRKNLDGNDLKSCILNIDSIGKDRSWVTFSFLIPLKVTPGEDYYIVCKLEEGSKNQDIGFQAQGVEDYPNGEGWMKGCPYRGDNEWHMLDGEGPYHDPDGDIDFCFRTYGFQKKGTSKPASNPLVKNILVHFFNNHPNMFSLIRQFLNL